MYDDDMRIQFPHLFDILVGYLDQDFDIEAETLEDAVHHFINDSTADNVAETRAEIARFLDIKANDLDVALERLGGLYSREPGMTARDYLLWLDGVLAEGPARKRS